MTFRINEPEWVPGREAEPGETSSPHEAALSKGMNADMGDSASVSIRQVSFGYVVICKPLWRLLRGFLELGMDLLVCFRWILDGNRQHVGVNALAIAPETETTSGICFQ